MATKTKAAKPKAKAKAKSKPKAKASPGFPNPEATYIPEKIGQEPALPNGATGESDAILAGRIEKAIALPRSKRSDFSVRDAAGLLRLLADETRITVVMLLARSPKIIVGDIVKNCAVSQPATSHHLSLLRHSGVVYCDRDGKHNRYSLTERGQIAAALLANLVES